MKLIIKHKNKRLNLEVKKLGFTGKYLGLMFKTQNTENLLFDFAEDKRIGIHSFFVFFPFLVVWLNDKNEAVEFKVVRPFEVSIKP